MKVTREDIETMEELLGNTKVDFGRTGWICSMIDRMKADIEPYTADEMHPPTPQGMPAKYKKRIEAMARALAYKGDHKQIVKDAVNIIKQIDEL